MKRLTIAILFIISLIGLIMSLLTHNIVGGVLNGTLLLMCSIVITNGISKNINI